MDMRPLGLAGLLLAIFAYGTGPEQDVAPVPDHPPGIGVHLSSHQHDATATCKQQATDYASARRQAMQTGRPLVVLVQADGCLPCAQMERDTIQPMLDDGEFDKSVFVRVNMTHQPELASVLDVTAAPTMIVYRYESGAWSPSRRVVGRVGRGTVRNLIGFGRVVTAPVRVLGRVAARVNDNYVARWQNYDGLSFEDHARIYHGIDTNGMSKSQIAMLRDADHDRYGGGHPPAMRSRMSTTLSVGASSCPTGGCPTAYSSSVTTTARSRPVLFPRLRGWH